MVLRKLKQCSFVLSQICPSKSLDCFGGKYECGWDAIRVYPQERSFSIDIAFERLNWKLTRGIGKGRGVGLVPVSPSDI